MPAAKPSWRAERTARRAAEASVARIARLQAATAALSASRTPDEVADAALGAGIAALDGCRGFVLVEGGGALAVLRCAGVSEAAARAAAAATVPNPAAEAFRTGASVFVEGGADLLARYPGVATSGEAPRADATAALPLRLEGRTIGVLAVGFDGPRRFGAADRALAHAVAAQCAEALDRARLFVSQRLARAEAVAARARLAFLDALSAHLAESPGEPEMLEGVARIAVPALGDWAGLFVTRERGEIALSAQAGPPALGAAVEAHLRADPLLRLAGACACGPPVAVDDFPEDAGGGRAAGSAVVAALCLRRRALGAFVVAAADPLRRYGPPDLALASDVAHRTALAVEHARLLREATASAQAREEFLHVASHELRGPIGTLRLAVQLLGRDARKGRTETVAGRLRVIERQAGRLGRLSDMLLDVSRITAGRLELAREPGDLAALVREVVPRFEDEAAEAGIAIRVDAPEEVRCTFDAARLDQVLSNLLSNAVKYGRAGTIDVRLRPGAGGATLEVEDRGIGIAPEDQERIFERFERAVSARHFAGLGLGLWIVRQIVEAHGGTIRVRSAPGEGATFTIELPL
ncbi:MAG TPA: ATP-binding protein [Anaeromyxobacter sp.]|nr:ATP-binding protein [Anaeromyxobacter sp.]